MYITSAISGPDKISIMTEVGMAWHVRNEIEEF